MNLPDLGDRAGRGEAVPAMILMARGPRRFASVEMLRYFRNGHTYAPAFTEEQRECFEIDGPGEWGLFEPVRERLLREGSLPIDLNVRSGRATPTDLRASDPEAWQLLDDERQLLAFRDILDELGTEPAREFLMRKKMGRARGRAARLLRRRQAR